MFKINIPKWLCASATYAINEKLKGGFLVSGTNLKT